MLNGYLRIPRKLRRPSRALLTALFVILVIDSFSILHSHGPTQGRAKQTPPVTNRENIFIASIHWNNEAILRSHWNHAVLDLVKHFGTKSVFVAILEGGSWDDSKGALRDLDKRLSELNVRRSVVLDNVTHKTEVSRIPLPNETGWIKTADGRHLRRRISYLADLRNQVMNEMIKESEASGKHFDKVIWLNDVVFTVEDVTTLLATRKGDYAAACSLDFSKPPIYYDTFALRDSKGMKTAMLTWPYFYAGQSRNALFAEVPIPVQSCWNGIVVMDAMPFYQSKPLKFRSLQDDLAQLHLEASECCLIHADNPSSPKKGVWLNPNVRVGYNAKAYEAVNGIMPWPTSGQRLMGIWATRLSVIPNMWRRRMEAWTINPRLERWKKNAALEGEAKNELGAYCIINEMQILVENGWQHI